MRKESQQSCNIHCSRRRENRISAEGTECEVPEYEIVFQSIGTGALVSKLQAEGKSTECDIFYDLEATNAEIILNGNKDLFFDLKDYDFSIYDASVTEYTKNHHKYAVNGKTDGTIVVNKKVLSQNGCDIPKTYEDLLKPEYKGLITMPSPKSSGTGYAFYNGLVSSMGEEAALKYFEALDKNMKEYTRAKLQSASVCSGSASTTQTRTATSK